MPAALSPHLTAVALTAFVLLTLTAFVCDLCAHGRDRPITGRNAVLWTAFWLTVAALYAGFLLGVAGREAAALFAAGYVFELSLSVDNLFVFMIIFRSFNIPPQHTHRVLYWGVLGAVLFRLLFVLAGSALFALGPWAELLFAAVIGLSALMMLRPRRQPVAEPDWSAHWGYRLVRRCLPLYPKLAGHAFFLSRAQAEAELRRPENRSLRLHRRGRWFATPLFVCLIVIEGSDVLFAFDSVPAVIALVRDPLIVYAAMMLAVLGLRSLYFLLDALCRYLRYLEQAVIALLAFIAVKLGAAASLSLWGHGFVIPTGISLAAVAGILGLGAAVSLLAARRPRA